MKTGNMSFGSMVSCGDTIGKITTLYLQDPWGTPELIETMENSDNIELVYKQHSLISNNFGQLPSRVYKIIFSCIDGKWNKSEPIYGKIIPMSEEYYEFD